MIPINSLSAHVLNLRNEIDASVKRVLDRAWFVLGPEVDAFEESFATYHGVGHCLAVANGTDALELGLRAIGVEMGDRVGTVANAGMYTSSALIAIGADPIYMDVDLGTRLAASEEIERVIALGVKTVVVTHLYGRAHPDIAEIAENCRKAGVGLVEDCAQAHGAAVAGKRVGSFGDVGCFSFYPTKNLGALGDGGAVICNDSALAAKIRQLRQYGWSNKYRVELAGGCNSRLDEVQAAILSVFLPHLEDWNARRRRIALQYAAGISHPDVWLPETRDDDVAHLFVIRSSRRDALRAHLLQHQVGSDIHYPVPDHRQPVFGRVYEDTHLPNTERLAEEVLTLPCYPEMTLDEASAVIDAVNAFQVG